MGLGEGRWMSLMPSSRGAYWAISSGLARSASPMPSCAGQAVGIVVWGGLSCRTAEGVSELGPLKFPSPGFTVTFSVMAVAKPHHSEQEARYANLKLLTTRAPPHPPFKRKTKPADPTAPRYLQ